jgi:hypothetical protein
MVGTCPFFLLVAAGAKIAPRNRRTTAVVLAAAFVAHSFGGHVLSLAPPGFTSDQLMQAINELLQKHCSTWDRDF